VPYPQGRHVRPPKSRCRHARATPQPVASAPTLPRRGLSCASKLRDAPASKQPVRPVPPTEHYRCIDIPVRSRFPIS
jgi:hypothetical protein